VDIYKNKAYLKDKMNTLVTNTKETSISNLYRGINQFKKDYQPRTNFVKITKVICLQISEKFGIGGRHTCQLLNVHGINNVRQR
jgi:hypothetical protein